MRHGWQQAVPHQRRPARQQPPALLGPRQPGTQRSLAGPHPAVGADAEHDLAGPRRLQPKPEAAGVGPGMVPSGLAPARRTRRYRAPARGTAATDLTVTFGDVQPTTQVTSYQLSAHFVLWFTVVRTVQSVPSTRSNRA